jgi:hypothetical protein
MKKISLRDAQLQGMRGNLDARALHRPEHVVNVPEAEPPKPEPDNSALSAAIEKVAAAVSSVEASSAMQSEAIARALESKAAKPAARWTFRVTERDARGNILAFTAEAN